MLPEREGHLIFDNQTGLHMAQWVICSRLKIYELTSHDRMSTMHDLHCLVSPSDFFKRIQY